ncbi:MAG: DNA polymerase subunit beta [Streptosporangiaceae bacterium]
MLLPQAVPDITGMFLTSIDARAPGLVEGFYLVGSLGFGGEFFPGSDIDFVAVLARRPGGTDLDALEAAHAEVRAAHPSPLFEGIHLVAADLAGPPARCPDLPYVHEGKFERAGRFSVNPVTWHELARHGITVRGPALTGAGVWTDDRALWEYSRGNLTSYWVKVGEVLVAMPREASSPEMAVWCVLGVSRLHHLLATGTLTSKSGAGWYALEAFEPRWHPIIREALRAREQPGAVSAYAGDGTSRGRQATDFTAMAIEAGLALPPL